MAVRSARRTLSARPVEGRFDASCPAAYLTAEDMMRTPYGGRGTCPSTTALSLRYQSYIGSLTHVHAPRPYVRQAEVVSLCVHTGSRLRTIARTSRSLEHPHVLPPPNFHPMIKLYPVSIHGIFLSFALSDRTRLNAFSANLHTVTNVRMVFDREAVRLRVCE